MTAPQVDYSALYRQLPVPVLALTPEFLIADANEAYLEAMGRTREDLLGRDAFDAFPDNPSDPGATGVRNSIASLRRVLATGRPDALAFQKYDVEIPGSPGQFSSRCSPGQFSSRCSPGQFSSRYWSVVNAPVLGPDSRVVLIAHCLEEVTERMRRFMSALTADAEHEVPG